MGHFIELRAADGVAVPAYLAQPQGEPIGALIVVQEIFGVNAHIRAVADGYAAAGYQVLAPATFQRVQPGVELGYTEPDVASGIALKARAEALPAPGVLQDLAAAVAYLAPLGRVGMVGYCWGGLLTWRSACLLDGLSAAVPYYGGGITTTAELARTPRCPVLAHFGQSDSSIPMAGVDAFRAAQPGVDVRVYAAGHGFNCDHRAAYEPTAAAQARAATLQFFRSHLGAGV